MFWFEPKNLTPELVLFNGAILKWAENIAVGKILWYRLQGNTEDENKGGICTENFIRNFMKVELWIAVCMC